MVLTAPQHSRIAATYEQASADKELPVQTRSAFAKKASWFRMVAEITAMAQIAGCVQPCPPNHTLLGQLPQAVEPVVQTYGTTTRVKQVV